MLFHDISLFYTYSVTKKMVQIAVLVVMRNEMSTLGLPWID